MPGLDGRGFLKRVRNLGGELDLRIIVLSAAPRQELERLRGPAGATEVMSKSDSLSQIEARIKQVLGPPAMTNAKRDAGDPRAYRKLLTRRLGPGGPRARA